MRTFAPHLGEYWERSHGGPIDFSLGRSPYGPVPDGPYHSAHRRAWGPFYIVRLTSANRPAVVVAVARIGGGIDEEWAGAGETLEGYLGDGQRLLRLRMTTRALSPLPPLVTRRKGRRATTDADDAEVAKLGARPKIQGHARRGEPFLLARQRVFGARARVILPV